MKKVLVTGGAGFVGSHLIEHILKNTDWDVVTLDRFDTAGNPNRLDETLDGLDPEFRKRIKFVFWDLKAELNWSVISRLGGPFDYIIHLAAGSHVDRSIDYPKEFFEDNCMGTINLLNYAKTHGLKKVYPQGIDGDGVYDSKFHFFSTDEVYGPAPFDMEDGYSEWDRHNPNNPYAAAKSAAEMACISYANTYRMPIFITNAMNIFGERQAVEKFIPLVISKTISGEKVFIHANKDRTQAGKRHYLHARNIADATVWLCENGKVLDGSAAQGRYNIVGEAEVDNEALAKMIAQYTNEWLAANGKETKELQYELVDFHSSRPGHDLRYALSGKHLAEEGFSYPKSFEDSLKKMVFWTLEHPQWLN